MCCLVSLCPLTMSNRHYTIRCLFSPWPRLSLSFCLRAYTELLRFPAKGKQPNKSVVVVDVVHGQFGIWFIVRFVSIRSVSFSICFHSFDHAFNPSICFSCFATCIHVSSQRHLHSSITGHMLYISFPASTVRLPHNFILYRMLIVMPVEVMIDTFINKTTPTATSQE